MFRTEDCPAKVAYQPQRQSYKKKPTGKPDVPPGFEGNNYADKLNLSTIPRIKWKRPPKVSYHLVLHSRNLFGKSPLYLIYIWENKQFLVSNTWLIGDGGESTERRTENLRISKVLEAIYPHRSTIPSRYLFAFFLCFQDITFSLLKLSLSLAFCLYTDPLFHRL